jgi:catechol 2,3-dioxygenase-like lactoylglutathione lyase family enzyme
VTRPRLDGLHHVKLPVSDLAVALDHYERAFGAVRLPEADHFRLPPEARLRYDESAAHRWWTALSMT